ncbi:MAG TPA: GTP-binding protein, partial [Polyangiaceae bacterium]|nr:GTP-binding protein [Polyangiaceae bacterium]
EDPGAIDEQRRADPNLDHERPLRELFEDQLSAADLVIVSKVDELTPAELARVEGQVKAQLAPGVRIVHANHGELPFDVVLGLERGSEGTIDTRHTHHDDDHEHGREHSHSLFDTLVIRLEPLERSALLRGLEAVVREHTVYRAKGFAAVSDKPMRLVVQGVGQRFESYFDRPWQPQEARATELVLIGAHLDRERITRTLLSAVGT